MVENGTVDEFQWRETKRGVEILAGDAQVLLRGVTVDQVALDHPFFLARRRTRLQVCSLRIAAAGNRAKVLMTMPSSLLGPKDQP